MKGPMLDILQQSFQNAHQPSQQVSVDEAMFASKEDHLSNSTCPRNRYKGGSKYGAVVMQTVDIYKNFKFTLVKKLRYKILKLC